MRHFETTTTRTPSTIAIPSLQKCPPTDYDPSKQARHSILRALYYGRSKYATYGIAPLEQSPSIHRSFSPNSHESAGSRRTLSFLLPPGIDIPVPSNMAIGKISREDSLSFNIDYPEQNGFSLQPTEKYGVHPTFDRRCRNVQFAERDGNATNSYSFTPPPCGDPSWTCHGNPYMTISNLGRHTPPHPGRHAPLPLGT